MKYVLTVLITIFSLFAHSQVPSTINYQGAARDQFGQPLANTSIGIRFELIQGVTATSVFTETQTIITNSLGLFSTQIGKTSPTGLSAINFNAGSLLLKIGIDVTGGSSFVNVGNQTLSSVPFALHAADVPASYTNNILSIGKSTFTLGAGGTVYTSGNGISVQNSIISNTAPDQTVTLTPGNNNVTVGGIYPNYTISTNPQLSLLGPGTLSVSNGNSVNINPTLSFSNGVLTVGASGNTIQIPSTSATTLQGSGAVSIVSLSPNSFSVSVPATTLTNGSNVAITGSFPAYTIAANPSLSISGNTLSISGGNSINLPATATQSLSLIGANTLSISGSNSVTLAPTIGVSGNALSVGPTSNSISLPTPMITGNGAVAVNTLAPNNFTITVPQPTLSIGSGSISISGGNAVALPAQVAQSLTLLPPNTVSITGGNTISIPAGSLIGTGVASVTPFGFNSFSVNVPQTNVNSGTNVQVNGTFPNYTIAATPQLALNSNTLSISGGNTVVIPSQVNQSLTLLSANTLSISNGNSITIAPILSTTNNVLSVGPGTNSVTLATPTIIATGALNANNLSANIYSLNVPLTQLSQGANVAISGIFPSYTIASTPSLAISANTISISNGNSIAIPSVALNAAGMATVANSGSSYTVGVPVWSYSAASGVLASGSNTLDLTQTLSLNAGTLSVGPASNSVIIPGLLSGGTLNYIPKWNSTTNLSGTSLILDDGTNIGIGTTTPTQKLDVSGSLRFSNALMPAGSAGTAGQLLQSAGPGIAPNWVTSGVLAGGTLNYLPKWNSATGLSSTSLLMDDGNNVGIGTTTPFSKLHVNSTGFSLLSLSTTGANSNVNVDAYPTGNGNLQITVGNGPTSGLTVVTGGATRLAVTGSGNVGVGTTSPLFPLDVNGQTQFQSSLISTGYETEIINNAASAISSGGLHVTNSGLRSIGNNAASIENLATKNGGSNSIKTGLEIISTGGWGTGGFGGHYNRGLYVNVGGGADGNYSAILMGGNVGIGNLAPNAPLQFTNTVSNRKIVLYEAANNDNQFIGFGVNAGLLRFQTDNTTSDHVFYAGVNATGSVELLRIKGTGNIGIGTSSPVTKLDIVGDVRIPATSSYSYSSPKTNYVSISANNFVSIDGLSTDGNATGNARWISSGIIGLSSNLYGGFQVPNGATITAIDVYVYDVDATYNLNANLVSFNMPSNSIGTSANSTSTSGSPGVATLSLSTFVTVNNSTSSYFIKLNTYQNNPNLWVRGARITYIVDQTD